ncbi:hypothetical protein [Vibrio phage vB_ValS_PJ32]|nr:hypothetical protein [Vibrio phage vB_ValS_PJ32]
MQTSESVTFVSSEGATIAPPNLINLILVDDPDNLDAVQLFEKNYFNEHGSSPTYVTKTEVEEHAQRLDQARIQSYSRVIRFYGYDKVSSIDLFGIQSKSVNSGSDKSDTTTENISLNGSTQISTTYPITSIDNITLDLREENGAKYTGAYEIDGSGVIQLDAICYGFITIRYMHQWREITVTGLDEKAADKRPAMLLVVTDRGKDSIEIAFPDVADKESAIEPGEDTYIRIWAHRNKNNRAVRDPLAVREFHEVTRTISPVDVDGVQIERALSVTMQEGDGGQNIRFTFDLPTVNNP